MPPLSQFTTKAKETIKRAHAVHPMAAVQSEYSLWTRDPETTGTLAACRHNGVAFVAYSPLGRGFLTGAFKTPEDLPADDYRRHSPRFQGENFARNLDLVKAVQRLAAAKGCQPSQLALAWVLARGEHVVAIPGTTKLTHLRDNAAAAQVELDAATMARLDALINRDSIVGGRYDAAAQAGVDTEEF